jgi:hypothetical protein
MGLRQKTLIAVVGGSGILVTILVVALSAVLWQFTMAGATRYAQTSAEMARVALTEAMLNGATANLPRLLNRLAETRGLTSVRVVRAAPVVEQFGIGSSGSRQLDDIDRSVLASAAPVYRLIADPVEPMFRATIPYIADTRGTPNCLTCHQAPEGSVLGAVTIKIGLGSIRNQGRFRPARPGADHPAAAVPVLLLLLRYLYQPVVLAADRGEWSRWSTAPAPATCRPAPRARR